MIHLGPWNTDDFDSLSWHDVHVHGLRLMSFEEGIGTADLALDIDYILKWDDSGEQLLFTICRAELIFHKVFGLKLELDYATPTAGMCPFSIDSINREPVEVDSGSSSFRWHILVNWPQGKLDLEATAFTQTLVGTPVVKARVQSLSPEERANAA